METTVLHRELLDAGFERAYTTLVGELRRLQLRPVCLTCAHRRGDQVTTEIDHPSGEEIQWDWLELAAADVPWCEAAYVLVGACRRKPNLPPGDSALAELALAGDDGGVGFVAVHGHRAAAPASVAESASEITRSPPGSRPRSLASTGSSATNSKATSRP